MKEVRNLNKGSHNLNVELGIEEPTFRTVKSCPNCHSIGVTYRKTIGDYSCKNCQINFNFPVLKQIKDRRNKLPVPPTLRKQQLTEQTYDNLN